MAVSVGNATAPDPGTQPPIVLRTSFPEPTPLLAKQVQPIPASWRGVF